MKLYALELDWRLLSCSTALGSLTVQQRTVSPADKEEWR